MNTRKIFSIGLMVLLVGNSILPSISSAQISPSKPLVDSDLSNNSYSSSKKIKSFLNWEKKILAFTKKDYSTLAMKLKNANTKKEYTAEYLIITDGIKKVFSNAKYSSDYMLPSHMTSLKKEIGSYKALRKELISLSGISTDPFSIPTDEITSVENDIIDLQKAITTSIRKALDNYDRSDFKETGKMTINTE
jgi:hypothetical protein